MLVLVLALVTVTVTRFSRAKKTGCSCCQRRRQAGVRR